MTKCIILEAGVSTIPSFNMLLFHNELQHTNDKIVVMKRGLGGMMSTKYEG